MKCDLSYDEARALNAQFEMMDMIEIPMRDSVVLNGRIYFPDLPKENLPTILIRSPYFIPNSEFRWFAEEIAAFLSNGYVVMLNNERGRYWSEGHYTFLAGAREDGYDVVDWIAKQPWSNGKVGTWGCSSSAEHQLGLITADHPAHAAAIPVAPGSGIGEVGPYHPQGYFYRGGVFQMPWVRWYYAYGYNEFPGFAGDLSRDDRLRLSRYYSLYAEKPKVDWYSELRKLPLMDLEKNLGALHSDYEDFIRRFPNDPRWEHTEFAGEGDAFGVPTLYVNSWYDVSFGPASMELFNYAQKHATDQEVAENQYMVIAATNHCAEGSETEEFYYGDRYLGDARFDYIGLYIRWFDHWLKGEENDVTDRKEVQLYTMGKNEWEYFDAWPPENAEEMILYLDSDGDANTKYGDGMLSTEQPDSDQADHYISDPSNPVYSLGDNDWGMIPEHRTGSYDQSAAEVREDVLVYSTPVLDEPVQVTGPVKVIVYLSSDAKDTDVFARLVDVYPDGRAFNVAESIQRARWRNGYDEPELMEKGEVYQVEIGPLLTSNMFLEGHRIRLEIAGSNFPRFARNLNTGGNNYDEMEGIVAHNQIHHGPGYSSKIILEVVSQ